MLAHRKSLLTTLILSLTLLIALTPTDANPNANANAPAHRRQASRMIKMRSPQLLGVVGVGEDPAADESGAAGGGTPTTSQQQTQTTTSSSSSSTSSTSSTTSPGTTRTTSSSSASTTSTSSSSSSTSSSSSSTSTSSETSETLAVTGLPNQASSSKAPSTLTSTITNGETPSAEAANESESAGTSSAAKSGGVSKTTITIIAVVGGCIGAAVILWTVIRKWKFRPSSEFEDRLQPIDWAPESTHAGVGGANLNRTASNASHGSFHSRSDHSHGGGYNAQQQRSLVSDIPQHDFTAGAAHLGVGNGYADLQRGNSPAMGQTANYGATFGRGYGY